MLVPVMSGGPRGFTCAFPRRPMCLSKRRSFSGYPILSEALHDGHLKAAMVLNHVPFLTIGCLHCGHSNVSCWLLSS